MTYLLRRYIAILITLLITYATAINAQSVDEFTYSHLGQAEGMSSQRVYSILQTPDGALWWATKRGVERYNGVGIKHYNLGNPLIFSSFAGRTIGLAMNDDSLYAYDNKGCIYTFNGIHDSFDLIIDLSKKFGGNALLNNIFVNDDGIWLAMYQGIYKLKGNEFTALRENLWANCIINTSFGMLFGTKEGLLDSKMRQVVPIEVESGFFDEKYNKVWLGGFANGFSVLSFDPQGNVIDRHFFTLGNKAQQNPVRSFCPYNDSTMLIGIDGLGVHSISRKDMSHPPMLLFDANDGEHGVLHGNGIYSVIKDSWNNIVIGSYSGGIDIARPMGSTMAVYEHVRNNHQTISNDRVNSVTQIGNCLLLGTDNGISILDRATNSWQHICHGTVVIDLFKTPDGHVLASTFGKGVYEVTASGSSRQGQT
ncbi:MAG: hypothetical protein J6S96_08785 [Muribaculaceae bacterium]|nr:hypothetical protein [Muribaculaceae bacterium]